MKMISKLATAAAVAAVGVGMTAGGASAYSITSAGAGGAFTGTQTSTHSFSAGGLTVACTGATFTGTATGAATAAFVPAYSGCTLTVIGLTFPAAVTPSGSWNITVDGNTGANYTGYVSVNNGVTIEVPDLGCEIYVNPAGNGTLRSGTAVNYSTPAPTGINLTANVTGITYSTNGNCFVANGTNATYAGNVRIPQVMVS